MPRWWDSHGKGVVGELHHREALTAKAAKLCREDREENSLNNLEKAFTAENAESAENGRFFLPPARAKFAKSGQTRGTPD